MTLQRQFLMENSTAVEYSLLNSRELNRYARPFLPSSTLGTASSNCRCPTNHSCHCFVQSPSMPSSYSFSIISETLGQQNVILSTAVLFSIINGNCDVMQQLGSFVMLFLYFRLVVMRLYFWSLYFAYRLSSIPQLLKMTIWSLYFQNWVSFSP